MTFVIRKRWFTARDRPEYYTGASKDKHPLHEWHPNINLAKRFSTQEDAEALVESVWPSATRSDVDPHWKEWPFEYEEIIDQIKEEVEVNDKPADREAVHTPPVQQPAKGKARNPGNKAPRQRRGSRPPSVRPKGPRQESLFD